MSEHACGGMCCRLFYLNYSPAKLGEGYLLRKTLQARGEALTAHDLELIYVAEMVIPLAEEDDETPTYTCKHLSPEGLCTAYEARPMMCRDYPSYGGSRACEYCAFSAECG